MGERKQINLLYTYNTNWIGGTYYVLNIIKAFNGLPDHEKPIVGIYSPLKSDIGEIDNIGYPYLKVVRYRDAKLIRLFFKI